MPSLAGGWRPGAWRAFVLNPWWVLGVALQAVGYGLYLAALRGAPLSVVHTALHGGIALFVLMAVVGLGERLQPREWLGVGAVLAGLVALSLSPDDAAAAAPRPGYSLPFLIGLLALAIAAMLLDRAPRRPIGISVASGLILGLAGMFAKQLAEVASVSAALRSINLWLTLFANCVGFAMMQSALQTERGVVAVPILSTLSNLVPIAGGIIVYGEALVASGSRPWLRPAAFLLALVGAGLLASFGEKAHQQRVA